MIGCLSMSNHLRKCEGCIKLRRRDEKVDCIIRFKEDVARNDCPCNSCIVKVTCYDLCAKFISYHFVYGREMEI